MRRLGAPCVRRVKASDLRRPGLHVRRVRGLCVKKVGTSFVKRIRAPCVRRPGALFVTGSGLQGRGSMCDQGGGSV